MHALEGLPLATFWQRTLGFLIDLFLAVLVWIALEYCWRRYLRHESNFDIKWDFHEVDNIVTMLLYWAGCNYLRNGQTPGKWMVRTRAISLVSDRLGAWQSM